MYINGNKTHEILWTKFINNICIPHSTASCNSIFNNFHKLTRLTPATYDPHCTSQSYSHSVV
ncbi:hypothetical protein BDV32DRAFT_14746 [Aspergillus pseudonomiae]|nr:hypothetical protein BDV32DRAFT_14746 [Aspergillus pseudonomiae]